MKSIFKSSRPARDGESRLSFDRNSQTSPMVDWNFQSAAPAVRGGASSFRRAERVSFAGLRALSDGFDAEARREYRLEAVGFVVIIALAIWPIAQAVHVLATTV